MSSRPPEDRPPRGRSRDRRTARHSYAGAQSARPSAAARRAMARRRGQARLAIVLVVVVLVIILVVAFSGGGKKGGGTASGQSPKPRTSSTPTTAALFTPTASKPLRLKNYGDSMGGELGMALAPLVHPLPAIKYWTYYKVSSSLVKPSFFDWSTFLKDDLPHRHLHAAIFMVGTNDGQGIQLSSGAVKFDTPAWRTQYAQRIDAVLKLFEQAGVRRVYWVGMPIMQSSSFSHVMSVINEVAKAEVGRHKIAHFVDAWKLFSTSSGAYDPRWRQSDGIHFNIAGQSRLAAAVLAAIKADWQLK
jgi:uncharacterized protein